MDFRKVRKKFIGFRFRDSVADSQIIDASLSVAVTDAEPQSVEASLSTPAPEVQTAHFLPKDVVPADQGLEVLAIPKDKVPGIKAEQLEANTSEETEIEAELSPNTLSQILWNEAYESIEADPQKKELVASYIVSLREYLGNGIHEDISLAGAVAISKELNDKTKRTKYLAELVISGKAKIEKSLKVSKVVGDIADEVLKLQPVMDIVLKVPQAAPAALPWAGVCIGLQMLANPKKATQDNLDGMSHLIRMMEWYCAIVQHLLEPSGIDSIATSTKPALLVLRPKIVELYKGVLLYQMRSVCTYYRNQGLNFVRQLVDLDDWKGSVAKVDNAEKDLLSSWTVYDKIKASKVTEEHVALTGKVATLLGDICQTLRGVILEQTRIHSDEKARVCLQNLRLVNPVDDMSRIEGKKEMLIDDTFKWIFEEEEFIQFTNWTDHGVPQCRLLWIKGDGGAGKTMLLMGIIRELSGHSAGLSPSLSYFFCQTKGETAPLLNNLAAVLRSLMWLLVIQQPNLISYLEEDYRDNAGGLFTDINTQQAMERIFKKMLENADPVYLIVDALDECEEGLNSFVNLIWYSLTVSEKVRWLVSSRPEVDLLETIYNRHRKVPLTPKSLSEINIQNHGDRVTKYVEQKLVDLKNSTYGKTYTDDDLRIISRKINNRVEANLLWACLVFQDLENMTGADSLKNIEEYPAGLQQLYEHKMKSLQNGGTKHLEWCKDVLVSSSLAYRPLSLTELARLVPWSRQLSPLTIVADCKAFLILSDDRVSVIHKSAREYLVHNQAQIQGGSIQGHADIARISIEAMRNTLRYDLYGTQQYGLKSKNSKPPSKDPLRRIGYSCVFWAEHLCSLEYQNVEYSKQLLNDLKILKFFQENLLNWLESLSLMGKLVDGIRSMRKLQRKIQRYDNAPELAEWFKEAENFVLCYGKTIENAPLQIYGAALIFSPTLSKIRKSFWPMRLPFIEDITGTPKNWSHRQQGLTARNSFQISFSPDNMTLATASRKRGEIIAFSPVSTMLASVPVEGDSKTQIWNTETGVLEHTLDHSDVPGVIVFSIVFSPDGMSLATASSDKQVRLWDISRASSETIFRFDEDEQVLLFSMDGQLLVAGPSTSGSHTPKDGIRLWNIANETLQGDLLGHSKSITALIAFPDQHIKKLASASRDGTVRIWDTVSGNCSKLLEHPDGVSSAAFSRDGQKLVTVWYSGIWLWDVASGIQIATIGLFSLATGAVAFSADGTTLASQILYGWRIQFWNVAVNESDPPFENIESPSFTHSIEEVGISNDGRLLALQGRKNIFLWDIAKKTCKHVLDYYEEPLHVYSVLAFSADDRTLIYLDRGGAYLYDTETGNQMRKFSGQGAILSPDAMTVGLILNDDIIQLWNLSVNSGYVIKPDDDEKDHTFAIAFSPDGAKIASLSLKNVRIWNAIDGVPTRTLPHNMKVDQYCEFTFSSNSKLFAITASPDLGLDLWDFDTGLVRNLLPHHVFILSMTFSRSGNMLAVSVPDDVYIWDVASNTSKKGPKHTFKSKIELDRLAFLNNDSCLHTNGGILEIPRDTSDDCVSVSDLSTLFVQADWIHFGPEAKLLLPEGHQLGGMLSQQVLVSRGIVVFGRSTTFYDEYDLEYGGFYLLKCAIEGHKVP